MDKTREVLAEMLKENTGTALCDSGGYPQYNKDGCYTGSTHGYGRSWEQNGCRDFEREAAVFLTFRWGSIDFTHNLYHWLADRIEYVQEMNNLFDSFVDARPEDETWHSLTDNFPKYLEALGFDVAGIYGEGEPTRTNTCNDEDLLSQTILYTYFTLEGRVEERPGSNISNGVYIILQIHGGCDVRGGYTRPRIFKASDMYGEEAILRNADGHISTEDSKYNWYTDDGYHWYEDGGSAGDNLEDKEIVDPEDFSSQIVITHSELNPNPTLPGLEECKWGTEKLIIKNVAPEQAHLLTDAFVSIFNAYSRLLPEIHATHDLDEDAILVDDLGQGWFRGSRLGGY